MAITDLINCECDDSTGYRTLAQLIADVLAGAGFINLQTPVDIRTLAVMRAKVFRMLGFAAMGSSYPPGMSALIDDWLNEAQQNLARRPEFGLDAEPLPAIMVADGDTNEIDAHAIIMLAVAMGKAHYGQPDAKLYAEQSDSYISLIATRRPPNAPTLARRMVISAHKQLYMRYDALRTERFFSWSLTQDVALYDIPDNEEACTKQLNPLKVRWVGVQDDNGGWRQLIAGIPPRVHGNTQTGRPERYEIRQCIEVWPAPSETVGTLVIKGHYMPEAFAADADVPTMDDELVYLMALANLKAHYRHPDAQSYIAQMETHLRKLVAGTHTTQRYIPGIGNEPCWSYVEPKYIGPDAW